MRIKKRLVAFMIIAAAAGGTAAFGVPNASAQVPSGGGGGGAEGCVASNGVFPVGTPGLIEQQMPAECENTPFGPLWVPACPQISQCQGLGVAGSGGVVHTPEQGTGNE